MSTPAVARTADWRAPAMAAFGSTCVGTVPAFAMGLYTEGFSPASLLFWRYWVALSCLIPLGIWVGRTFADDWRRSGPALILNAVTLGAMQTYCYFRAIQTVPTSIVVTIFFSYPIFTLLIDRFWLGQKLATTSIIAALTVLFGVILASWPRLTTLDGDLTGLQFALAGPFIFSIYLAVSQRYTRHVGPLSGATFIYFGLALTYSVVVMVQGLQFPKAPSGWLSLIAIGTIGGALQIFSFAYALPRLNASGYGIIVSLELVTVAVIGVLVLGEQMSLLQVCGLLLVVVAIIVDRLRR